MAIEDGSTCLVDVSTPTYPNATAIIDLEDLEIVSKFKWSLSAGYARAVYYTGSNRTKNFKQNILKMHRLVMQAPLGVHIDHINGDKLDNRKSNLRYATVHQNIGNSRKHIVKTSIYKGVSWHKTGRKWRAYIAPNRKQIHLGFFESEVDAAKAYDVAAMKIFKNFAYLNFPII